MKKLHTLLLVILLGLGLCMPSSAQLLADGSRPAAHSAVVSPNPARNAAAVQFANPNGDFYQVELYDVIGNKMLTVSNGGGGDKSRIALDLSDVPSGVYFYFLKRGSERVSTGRLIVKR